MNDLHCSTRLLHFATLFVPHATSDMHNATPLVPYCTPQMHSIPPLVMYVTTDMHNVPPLVTYVIKACFSAKSSRFVLFSQKHRFVEDPQFQLTIYSPTVTHGLFLPLPIGPPVLENF